ncbi:MAG TPA: hypothetical protein VJ718_08465, partial [Candidatus Binataceae bacterium]|nr:hypothetical protein [Candidatus Binataceae bacterium]
MAVDPAHIADVDRGPHVDARPDMLVADGASGCEKTLRFLVVAIQQRDQKRAHGALQGSNRRGGCGQRISMGACKAPHVAQLAPRIAQFVENACGHPLR